MKPIANSLFDHTLGIMGKSLGLRLVKHGLTTSNLANLDTPGYEVRTLDFEKTLQEAVGRREGGLEVRRTSACHLPQKSIDQAYSIAQHNIVHSPYGQDEKGLDVVDIDQEMTKLAKNHLLYNATVQMLAKEFENLKYAISEGGR